MKFAPAAATFALIGCSGPGPSDGDTEDPCLVSGNICTISGTPEIASYGAEDIPATESGMYLPVDLTFRPDDGRAYVIDWNNHRIRVIEDDGTIHTVAGTGFLGDGPPGESLANSFNHPTNLQFDPANPSILAIAAWHNSRIELLDVDNLTIDWVAGTGDRNYNGSGGEATTTDLDLPSSVAWDGTSGELYFFDQANQLIRVLDVTGKVFDVGGEQRYAGYKGDGGPVTEANFHASTGQAADPSNRIEIRDHVLYLVDSGNHIIRTVDLDTMIVDRYAGITSHGYSGDGGDALDAQFSTPRDLAIGIDGEVYVADTDNHCVRVIRDGIVETVAGICDADDPGFSGDGGPATEAQLHKPFGIAVDLEGALYVADTYNHVIRKITR
ncbi:MAG: hypothetical protein ABMB14_01705 [Myxococcota bacterium]